MEAAARTPRYARFGPFEADLSSGLLTRKGVRVRIGLQPFQVLALLLRRPGEIITREELRRELWPNGTFVDFEGSLNSALKKLRAALGDDPKDSQWIETLPKRGYRLAVPVIFASSSAGEENRDTSESGMSEKATPPDARRHVLGKRGLWLQWRNVGLVSIAVLAALAISIIAHRRSNVLPAPTQFSPRPPIGRPSIAVLGFRNLSDKAGDAWVATALSEMLSTELAGGGGLRLVSGEDVANLRHTSPWPEIDSLDPKTTANIGTALGSDFLILGSYTVIEDSGHGRLRIDARLQDAKSGRIVLEAASVGDKKDLFRIVSQLGGRLREGLKVPALGNAQELGLMASLPLDPGTARFYALGLEKLRSFDALAAKDLLEQAVASDPKFSLAHTMLARAWGALGYEQKRKEETRKALDLSADLPRAERLLVEGDYYESLGDHEKAASVYHALYELYPDDVEYGLQLAASQKLAGHTSGANETLRRLRELPPPASQDPRIDLAQVWGASSKTEELTLIRRAMEKAQSQGNRLIYAQARKRECLTLNFSDHPEVATPSCEEAYKIFFAAGNLLEAADCVRLLGDNQGYLGHEESVATYQRALAILKGLGEHEKTGAVLNNLAIHFENEGQLDRAGQLYEQARFHFAQAGDKPNEATAIGNAADILYERGNLEGAAKRYEEALQIEATLDPGNPGYVLYRLADLELTEGRVQEARRHAEAAVKAFPPERGEFQYLTGAMLELGEILEAQGDLAGARREFGQSLAIREKVGAPGLVEENQQQLAELELEEGHADQAEPLIQNAIAEFEKEKSIPAATSAYTSLARVFLAEGKVDEARKAIRHALQLCGNNTDPALKMAAEIQDARVKMAEEASVANKKHDFSASRRELQSVIMTCKRLGYSFIESNARLALGSLEMEVDPASGRSRLRTLVEEAQNRGMALVVSKATKLENPTNTAAGSVPARLSASAPHP